MQRQTTMFDIEFYMSPQVACQSAYDDNDEWVTLWYRRFDDAAVKEDPYGDPHHPADNRPSPGQRASRGRLARATATEKESPGINAGALLVILSGPLCPRSDLIAA